jgi:hypothetical protein
MGRDELGGVASVEIASAAAPARCFLCGYYLTGLPDGQTCPECGTRVGLRAWRTTGGRVVWQRAVAVMLIVSLAPLLLGAVRVMAEISSLWTIAAGVLAVAILAVTAGVILKRLSRPPARHDVELTLCSQGLIERSRGGQSIHVPWSGFGSVRAGRELGGVWLLTLRRRVQGGVAGPAVSYIVDGEQIAPDALREQIERLIAGSDV